MVVGGSAPGRTTDSDITLFESQGPSRARHHHRHPRISTRPGTRHRKRAALIHTQELLERIRRLRRRRYRRGDAKLLDYPTHRYPS